MDPKLLQYYNQELRHLREVGGEFAAEFPKIAARLGLDNFECADPYVERLLEGFAFLAARVQLKVDAEFPTFTQHLLEIIYPHYLAPTPSMTIVQMQPDAAVGNLAEGFPIPRDTSLRSQISRGEQTACEYRTAHDVTLWPIQLIDAEYLTAPSAITNLGAPAFPGAKAAIRLRLKTLGGIGFDQLPLESLPMFLQGSGEIPFLIYEQLRSHVVGVAALGSDHPSDWSRVMSQEPLASIGFKEAESLLPAVERSFQGYRLLQEYFAFKERFLFVNLTGLRHGLSTCTEDEVDIILALKSLNPVLVNSLSASNFMLYCTPAINLFPRRTDRVQVTNDVPEYHVLADRTRPMDFEIHTIENVSGYGDNQDREQVFHPFFGSKAGYQRSSKAGLYSLQRRKRVLSSRQRREGLRTSYVGHEVFLSLVDETASPLAWNIKQLGLSVLCTNRDLPLMMPLGVGDTDFTLRTGAPVISIRCLAGPTKPRPSRADGDNAWRLINHLSLNYLSLTDGPQRAGATSMRELLGLYADLGDSATAREIEGLLSVQSRNVVRRIASQGPIVFGRGLEVTISLEETAFEGSGAFLFGEVLDHFFARYASINTFTETVVRSTDRGEIMRWPIRVGQRHTT